MTPSFPGFYKLTVYLFVIKKYNSILGKFFLISWKAFHALELYLVLDQSQNSLHMHDRCDVVNLESLPENSLLKEKLYHLKNTLKNKNILIV